MREDFRIITAHFQVVDILTKKEKVSSRKVDSFADHLVFPMVRGDFIIKIFFALLAAEQREVDPACCGERA